VVVALVAKFGSVYGNEVFLLVYQNVNGNCGVSIFKFRNGRQSDRGFDTGHVQLGEVSNESIGIICLMLVGRMDGS